MCLGIPGQVVALFDDQEHLATVDVNGVHRMINIALLSEDNLTMGDWVLVHVGFAMSKIDEHEAAVALAALQMMGGTFNDEMEALLTSASGEGPPPVPDRNGGRD